MTTQAAISGHEAEHTGPNYIAVFIYLSVLTAIELGVYAMGLPQVAKVGLLIALAWAKAVLEAMCFMHLRDLTTRMWTRFDHPRPVTNPAEMGANPVAPPPMQTP